MMKELELYVYSTDKYLEEGLVKVGCCKIGRHKERIQEQFGTSNPENPRYLLIGSLPSGMSDKNVHEKLIKNGIKKVAKSPGKEWFIASFDDVKKAYNQIVYGSSRRDHYKLRIEQEKAIEKARRWFFQQYPNDVIGSATYQNRFLMNAKMRFGKCFTSIHLAKSLNVKRVLIVTYKPEVIDEWVDVVNEHVDFDGWLGVRARNKVNESTEYSLSAHSDFFDRSGVSVLCVSLQDLWIDKHGNAKDRLQKIPQVKWDLVIFDEVHYGSRTERAKHILKNLNFTWRLDLSGTPFKIIQNDDFCTQQVYVYSYLDEQANKKEEILNDACNVNEKIYRLLPDLDLSAIQITESDISEQREIFETDDMDFSLNRLFETNEGRFLYGDAIDHFIGGLACSGHEARSISVYGKLGQQLNCPPKRHTVWWLNRVDSIKATIKKLEVHPYFSNFIIIDASGSDVIKEEDDKVTARAKNEVKSAIKEASSNPNKLGTITLTCGRFLTGVTIEEWDSILILNDTKSAEAYFQAIFRVQSAWFDKKTKKIFKPKGWVFDFSITRCLTVTYDCANNIADQLDQHESYEGTTDINNNNLDLIAQDLCEKFDIKRFYEGSLVSSATTAKDIFELLNHEGSKIALARRITSNFLVNFAQLKLVDDRLREILEKIKGYRTQNVSEINTEILIQIGVDADTLEEIKSDINLSMEEKEIIIDNFLEKDKSKERKAYKKWYATQIKRLALCMVDFIYMTYERESNIDDIIETKSPRFFEIMTGISKEDFRELCEIGFINRSPLNRIVREFKDQEVTSLNPDKYIYDNIYESIYQVVSVKNKI